jgi:hypothetical protein
MLTGQSDPRVRRYRPLLALAAGLPIALAATSGAIALADRGAERTARSSSCTSSSSTARLAAPAVHATALDAALAEDASTGLDLEVRIGRIRVEFPWLKTLPITPGRHVVFTLLPVFDTESR